MYVKELEAQLRNLRSLLSYYRQRTNTLEERVVFLSKGAISTEYDAFFSLADDILYMLERQTTKEELRRACLRRIREITGTDKKTGRLAREINHECLGIMEDMCKDFPEFGPYEINFAACIAINLRQSLVMEAFDLGTAAKTANEKSRIIKRVWSIRNRARVKYAKLLDRKDCTNAKKLLSLQELSKFCNGKPKKNKD